MSWEPSVEPLSAIKTSPEIPSLLIESCACLIHNSIVSASFKHGIKQVKSNSDMSAGSTLSATPSSSKTGYLPKVVLIYTRIYHAILLDLNELTSKFLIPIQLSKGPEITFEKYGVIEARYTSSEIN